MTQPALPLAYPSFETETKTKYKLPYQWKAVFVLLLLYSVAISTITYVRASQAKSDLPANSTTVQMKATVPGWYNVESLDNANLIVNTNMKVWVNGREFIRLGEKEQKVNQDLFTY